ncbi:hypothetical protein HN51_064967, partial [Arachis hypogaea]
MVSEEAHGGEASFLLTQPSCLLYCPSQCECQPEPPFDLIIGLMMMFSSIGTD